MVETAARFPSPFFGLPIPICEELMTNNARWTAPTHPTLLDTSADNFILEINEGHILDVPISCQYLGTRATFRISGNAIPPNTYIERGTRVDFILHSPLVQYRVQRCQGIHEGHADIEVIAWLADHTGFYDLSSQHWPPIILTFPRHFVAPDLRRLESHIGEKSAGLHYRLRQRFRTLWKSVWTGLGCVVGGSI